MSKKYVVQGASIHCRYGSSAADRKLYTSIDTGVKAGKKFLTTEVDNSMNCMGGGFGVCTSQYVDQELSSMMHGYLANQQQMTKVEGFIREDKTVVAVACKVVPAFFWQNTSERVEVYGGRALLEDSWLFCTRGMGFITIDNHGQSGENPAQLLEENLKKLEKAVDEYMKANGIDEKYRDALIESVLLWNGYYILPWAYEGTEMTRAFCSYLEETDPALFNFFERGLYLPEGKEVIDLTYMLGIYKAREQNNSIWGMMNRENVKDPGMLNGYLEAFRTLPGKSTMEVVEDYLTYYLSPDYDSSSRYTGFLSYPDEVMRDYFFEQPLSALGEITQYSFMDGSMDSPYGTVGEAYHNYSYNDQQRSESERAVVNRDTIIYYISREGNTSDEDIETLMKNIDEHIGQGGD